MALRTLFTFCILFFGISPSFSSSDSSRVADLLKLVNENRSDSVLAYTNLAKAYDIASSSKDKRLLGDVYISVGIMHYLETEFDSCETYWKEASQIFSKAKDTLKWGKAERLVGVAFDLQGRLDSSLFHLQLALTLNKSINYKTGIGEVYMSLGIIQQKLDRFEAALETYKEALQLAIDEGNEKAFGPIYNNLGSLYQNMGALDSGMKYLGLALSMQDQVDNPLGKAKILHNIGTIELEKQNYKRAKDYYFTSIALTGGTSSYESLQGITSIGNCYLMLGQYDSARTILLIAKKVNEEKQAGRSFKSIYNYLWQVEENQGNYEKALAYHKLYSRYQDTVYDEILKKSIRDMESSMELEFEKDKNESLQKSSAEINSLLDRNRQGVVILVILSLVLLVLIFVLIRNLLRLKSSRSNLASLNTSLLENTAELEDNNRKLETIMTNKNDLVSVMAHDLRSPFGKIQSIVQLFELSTDENEQKSYLQMLDNITRDGMALIQDLIDLSRLEGNVLVEDHIQRLSTFKLSTVFAHLKSSFTSHLEAKNLEIVLDISDTSIVNREDYCERICDNILSNAIKYSNPNGAIHVSSIVDGDMMKIIILDNGPGFKQEDMNRLFQRFSRLSARPTGIETSTGLGLYIAKKLVESIHGDILLMSKPGEPAKFCIEIPLDLKSKLEG